MHKAMAVCLVKYIQRHDELCDDDELPWSINFTQLISTQLGT